MDAKTLLERIRSGWDELQRTLADLGDERLEATPHDGGWSGKDQLAHLTGWHRILLARLTGEGEHDVLGLAHGEYESKDIDGINERIHERNRDRPLDEIRAEFEASSTAVFAAISEVPEERLSQPWLPENPDRGTFADTIAANTFEHYEEHAPLLAALEA